MIEKYLKALEPTEMEFSKSQPPLLVFKKWRNYGALYAGFTTKLGGVSTGCYASFNLGYNRGDNKNAVYENYLRLAKALGIKVSDIVSPNQTHTINVEYVNSKNKATIEKKADVDGLITDEKGLVLMTFYADCVPLYFYDEKHLAIGLSHAGWRGTVKNMADATISSMKSKFNSSPRDIKVAIGPSIAARDYEVGEEVAREFMDRFSTKEIGKILYSKGEGKYLLDLWQANKSNLIKAGILEENIIISGVSTYANADLLYSHRVMGTKRGSLAALMYLKK